MNKYEGIEINYDKYLKDIKPEFWKDIKLSDDDNSNIEIQTKVLKQLIGYIEMGEAKLKFMSKHHDGLQGIFKLSLENTSKIIDKIKGNMKVTNVMDRFLRVTMPDGSRYDIPVSAIARNRADHYKGEFDDDIEKSLKEDTIPLFEEDDYEIKDWAAGNMNWSDISHLAVKVEKLQIPFNFEEGWMNGEKEII